MIAPAEKAKRQPRMRGRRRAEVASKPPTIEGPSSSKPPTLSPGVKLSRTYKGKKITVTVMEGGKFEWNGKFFASLSALAHEISGQHCSGPAFFGLRAKKETAS